MKVMLTERLFHWTLVMLLAAVAMILTSDSLGAQTAARAPEVTFTKNVAPILQQRCQECHRPNAIAPMSWP